MKKIARKVVCHATQALWLTLAMACSPAPESTPEKAAPAAAEPSGHYAFIDWPDPLNPRFAPLGDGFYLLSTKSGKKVWAAGKNLLYPARQWPADTEVSTHWSALDGGRVLVGLGRGATFNSLVWWSRVAGNFSEPLVLPASTGVQALVPVGEHNVLACMTVGHAHGEKDGDRDAVPTRAVVIEQANGKLHLLSNITPALRATLLDAGVRGDLEGGLRLDDAPTQNSFPLVFNTARCKWEMRNAPDELKKAKDLTIQHYRLPDGAVLVAHADWFDEERQARVQLIAPYLWNAKLGAWEPTSTTAQDGGSPDTFNSFGVDDLVVTTAAVGAEYVEFLDTNTLRWTRSAQRLPRDTYSPKPAPFDKNKVLVFLRERGEVLLIEPMKIPTLGEFTYAHSYLGEVHLSDASLLLLGGGSEWHPTNRPELLRVSQQPVLKLIAPLPSLWNYLHGVELRDKTILAFGGLPPGCEPNSKSSACQKLSAQPVYRYMPQSDRWEVVPDLSVRSNGESSEYADHIDHRWKRGSAMARSNGDFVFLDGPTLYEIEAQSMTPLASTLMRWNPISGTTQLGKLRQARTFATVLELNDQRLVVVGGETGKKLVSTADQCLDCDDDSVSTGAMEPANTTEIFDDASAKWRPGPTANFGGGRAMKLANGKIFKLSLVQRYNWEDGYSAEIADSLFSSWKALPSFPQKQFKVKHVAVAGNRVLLFSEKSSDNTVLWDDTRQAWRIWEPWFKTEPLSVVPLDATRALVRSAQTYEIVNFPN